MNIIGMVDDEQELQRYVSFEKYMDFISTKKIFLSKISAFDDHLEGAYTPVMAFLSGGGGKALENLVHSMPMSENSEVTVSHQKEISERSQQKLNTHEMSSVFKGYPFKVYSGQLEDIKKGEREWINAVCWHGSNAESMAMWKIYGENDNAVCIISDVASLRQSVKTPKETILTLAKIEYIDHLKEEFKILTPLASYIHKSYPYAFEKEYRLLAYNPNERILDKRPNSMGVLLDVDICRLVKEIRVSHKSPDWFFEMVKRFTKVYISKSIPVTRSEMGKNAIFS
jgi:hypothetical protein